MSHSLEVDALYYAKNRIEEGAKYICNRIEAYMQRLEQPEFKGSNLECEILEFIPDCDTVEYFLYEGLRPHELNPQQIQHCRDFRLNMINVMLERRGVKC